MIMEGINNKTKTKFLEKIEVCEKVRMGPIVGLEFDKRLFEGGYCIFELGIGERVELEGKINEIIEKETEIDRYIDKDYELRGENFKISLSDSVGIYKTIIGEYKDKKAKFYAFKLPYSQFSISLLEYI